MKEMFFESKSKYSFDETIEKLNNYIVEGEWRVLQVHDLKETMHKNGFEVLSVKVIELCKPKYAHRLLSKDRYRVYANMLPCRISVYEKEDGKTYVSRINMPLLASKISGEVEEVMSEAYHNVEMFISKITD